MSALNDAAKIHLIIAAQGTAHPAAHPCLHETGYSLMIPTRGIPAGYAQIAPQSRYGMGVIGTYLCSEKASPAQVTVVVLVAHHYVSILVGKQLLVALNRGIYIIRHGERRHSYLDKAVRQRGCASVTVVLPVGDQHERRFGNIYRIGGPYLLMESLSALEHTHHVGYIPGQVLVKEDKAGLISIILIISLSCQSNGSYYEKQQEQKPGKTVYFHLMGAFHIPGEIR